MQIFRLNHNSQLTPLMIVNYIRAHAADEAREQKLINYYRGDTAIKQRQYSDASKPCNRVSAPYATHLSDTAVGYFVGKPITYTGGDDNLMEQINQIIRYNDDAAENSTLAKYASICGVAYELLYIDNDGLIRYKALDPSHCIPIFCSDMDGEMLYFLRYWTDTDIITHVDTTYVQVYSRSDISTYRQDESALTLVDRQPHNFGMVPVAIYQNNDEQIGDFELVMPLIDAYDAVQSDSVDAMDYFADSYLLLSGMMGTDTDDIQNMRTNRVLLVDSEGDAKFLTKEANDAEQENLKTRLVNDIYQLSGIPNLTDDGFATTSGIALRYRLLGLETKTSAKETLFRRGLQRRFELICAILRLMGYAYDYRDISITFTRNLPVDSSEVVNILNSAGHLLSKETQLALLPYDIDVEKEIEKKQKEDETGYDNYGELMHDGNE